MKRAILFVAFAALCGAQTTVNGGRDYKGTLKASGSVSVVDFSSAGSTAPAKAGTSGSRPTACTQGQIYFATDVAAGQNLYFCTVTGAPGIWTQMSGNAAGATTAGGGAPAGSCAPPMLYIDTTNQDLWYCGATNTWRKPTADTSGFATAAGTNAWTGYNNFSGGQWRPPESTVGNLPNASGNAGKVFMVTDAVTAGSCSNGGGLLRELCRANGSTYECVGGCGSAGGGGGSVAYLSSLMTGPDSTRTITGGTHGFATAALLVGVYDNASPRNAISVGWTVNPATYDVAITFASPQSNYYVVINGGGGAGIGSTLTGLVRGSASVMTAAELSGDVTTSGTNAVTIAANAVGSSKMAVVNTRRTCVIDRDARSAAVLTAAQITGRCEIPVAAHIVEVGVWGGTGTGGTQAYTGTGAVQLTRYRPNGATTAAILSATLATPGSGANKACAVATISGTCINGLTSSGSVTLAGGATVTVNAGDLLYVSTATADGVQTWYTVTIVYTVD